MNKTQKQYWEEIYKDCKMLARRHDLTEFGEGRFVSAGQVLGENKECNAYNMIKNMHKRVRKMTKEQRKELGIE